MTNLLSDSKFHSHCFDLTMNTNHPIFELHEFRNKFYAKTIVLESKGFNSYDLCAFECKTLCMELASQLKKLSNIACHIAWEANPKSIPLSLGISTQSFAAPTDWLPGELVKIYLVTNETNPVTVENIDVVAKASIYLLSRAQKLKEFN